jgi:hypothetical protein
MLKTIVFLTDFPCKLCGRSPLSFCNKLLIDSKYSGLFYFFINSFRNSSFVSPACMIARRVLFFFQVGLVLPGMLLGSLRRLLVCWLWLVHGFLLG